MNNLSLETTILLSLFIFIVVLFCVGSVFNNGKKDKKKNEPFMSRRQKLKEYNKRERRE